MKTKYARTLSTQAELWYRKTSSANANRNMLPYALQLSSMATSCRRAHQAQASSARSRNLLYSGEALTSKGRTLCEWRLYSLFGPAILPHPHAKSLTNSLCHLLSRSKPKHLSACCGKIFGNELGLDSQRVAGGQTCVVVSSCINPPKFPKFRV